MAKDNSERDTDYKHDHEDKNEGDANPWLYRLGDLVCITECLKTRSLDLCFFILLLKHAR